MTVQHKLAYGEIYILCQGIYILSSGHFNCLLPGRGGGRSLDLACPFKVHNNKRRVDVALQFRPAQPTPLNSTSTEAGKQQQGASGWLGLAWLGFPSSQRSLAQAGRGVVQRRPSLAGRLPPSLCLCNAFALCVAIRRSRAKSAARSGSGGCAGKRGVASSAGVARDSCLQ